MSFDSLLIHRLTVRRMTPATDDRYGNAPLEHDADADVTVRGRVDVMTPSEDITDRELQRDLFRVYVPPATVIDGTDELEWLDEGIILKVDGPPVRCHDGFGLHHLEVAAYRTRG